MQEKGAPVRVLKADCGSAVDFVNKSINGGLVATSHYGSVAYQIANEDFIPFGCQMYINSNAKNYNCVIYNSNIADDNRPGVCATTSGSYRGGNGPRRTGCARTSLTITSC